MPDDKAAFNDVAEATRMIRDELRRTIGIIRPYTQHKNEKYPPLFPSSGTAAMEHVNANLRDINVTLRDLNKLRCWDPTSEVIEGQE